MPRRALDVRPAPLTVLAALVGVAVTGFVTFAPFVRFAYRSVPTHVALETGSALTGALLAFLSHGRWRRTGEYRDRLLVDAFGVLAIGDLMLGVVPTLVGDGTPGRFAVWALVAMRLWGACLLAGAAVTSGPAAGRRGGPIALAALAVTLGGLALAHTALPTPLDPTLSPDLSAAPRLTGHAALLAVQLAQLIPYAVASVAFTRRATRDGDVLTAWLGAGAALGACARLNYFLFPSIYSQWVYTGDLLRTGCQLMFLVGAALEIQGYWAREVEAVVVTERRRMARDLHDGAVQEIGYVRRLAAGSGADDEELARIAAAADRALGELRGALSALTAPADEPLLDALTRAAEEVADRYDVAVRLHVDQGVTVEAGVRNELVRIVREAVGNAARHGGAGCVKVTVGTTTRGCSLVVEDDGCGFDPAVRRPGGFGLQGMQDRSEAIGGRFAVTSRFGAGTRIEVSW